MGNNNSKKPVGRNKLLIDLQAEKNPIRGISPSLPKQRNRKQQTVQKMVNRRDSVKRWEEIKGREQLVKGLEDQRSGFESKRWPTSLVLRKNEDNKNEMWWWLFGTTDEWEDEYWGKKRICSPTVTGIFRAREMRTKGANLRRKMLKKKKKLVENKSQENEGDTIKF